MLLSDVWMVSLRKNESNLRTLYAMVERLLTAYFLRPLRLSYSLNSVHSRVQVRSTLRQVFRMPSGYWIAKRGNPKQGFLAGNSAKSRAQSMALFHLNGSQAPEHTVFVHKLGSCLNGTS